MLKCHAQTKGVINMLKDTLSWCTGMQNATLKKACCKYQNIGCQKELLRRYLEKHENDTQYHIQFATKAVSENVTAIQDVKYTVDELERRVDENVYEIKAKADKQHQAIKRQENTIARLQSIIVSQSKEISELKSKLERTESDEDDQVSVRGPRRASSNFYWGIRWPWVQASNTDPNQKSVFKFTDFAQRKSDNIIFIL